MTTPHQAYPEELTRWLGVGAYEVGGGDFSFGQGITEDVIDSLAIGPRLNDGTILFNLPEAITKFGEFLLRLPLDAVRLILGLIPGLDPNMVTDVTQAVSLITNALRPLPDIIAAFTQLATDIWEAFVEFSQTFDAGDLLNNLDDAWVRFWTTLTDLGEETIVTLQELLQIVFRMLDLEWVYNWLVRVFAVFSDLNTLLLAPETQKEDWEDWFADVLGLVLGEDNSLAITIGHWLAGVWYGIVSPIEQVLLVFGRLGDLLSNGTSSDWADWFKDLFAAILPGGEADTVGGFLSGAWFSIIGPVQSIFGQLEKLEALLLNPSEAAWKTFFRDLFRLFLPSNLSGVADSAGNWLGQVWYKIIKPAYDLISIVEVILDSLRAIIEYIQDPFNRSKKNASDLAWSALAGVVFP